MNPFSVKQRSVIKSLLFKIVFVVCCHMGNAQPLDTFFIVSQYRFLGDNATAWGSCAGHFPMQVYLPNNQAVSLFAKPYRKKPPIIPSQRTWHCLRIVKQRDSLLTIRVATRDSIFAKSQYQLAVDTTLTVTELPFYRNVFLPCYGGNSSFRNPSKIYISNRPKDLAYIPQNSKKKRMRYLKRRLQYIQYEYNAVTGKLTQLY